MYKISITENGIVTSEVREAINQVLEILVQNNISDVANLPYTPSNTNNWNASGQPWVPTTVRQALDNLAERLDVLEGGVEGGGGGGFP